MLGLNNDLAEYYMGHKLGSNAKTTYIQVNRLNNRLFVEEYAQPVIEMMDKFVFYSEDELKKMKEEEIMKRDKRIVVISSKIQKGMNIRNAIIDYMIMEYKERTEDNDNSVVTGGYFDRI